ncbi:MAG TPA: MFS transporter [Mycobacteriales bacterium]|nr:MFS transporter [Mycobacteriales bacterium]
MTRSARRFILVLTGTAFVEWLGASAILPLLPAYLRHQGTSTGGVGLVMSAYFFAGLLVQYPLGRLGDRIGQRPVLIGGLLSYAVGSLGFLLHPDAIGYIVLRGAQGAGAGAVQVASFALVGAVVPIDRRGRAFSWLFAGQLGGMAIGPLAGSLAGISGMAWLFVATAATSTVASLWVVTSLPKVAAMRDATHTRLVVSRLLLGVVVTGVVGGLITGVYETCWTLLLDLRGAHAWEVGLSWTLFAAPFAAFSPVAGWMTDHLNRIVLTIAALTSSVFFAALYPFLHTLPLLIGLGSIESIGVAVAYPAAQSLLAQSVPAAALGRAQGLSNATQTAAMAVSAAAAGALFGIAPWVPFVGAAASAAVLIGCLPLIWRHGVPQQETVVADRKVSVVV